MHVQLINRFCAGCQSFLTSDSNLNVIRIGGCLELMKTKWKKYCNAISFYTFLGSLSLQIVFIFHQHERERPVSAQSDDFVEGFRAGVRAKQEKERELHRESIGESENILRRGLLESFVFIVDVVVILVMFSSCFSLGNGNVMSKLPSVEKTV